MKIVENKKGDTPDGHDPIRSNSPQKNDRTCQSCGEANVFPRLSRTRKESTNLKSNIFYRLMAVKIKQPDQFLPDESFTIATGISPARYQDLVSGKGKVSGEEIVKTASFFGISSEDAMKSRQLMLFDENEN